MTSLASFSLKKSIAESIYNELLSGSAKYYYYVGKAIPFVGSTVPEDTYDYELETRKNIISVKQLSVSDLAFVIRKITWVSGTIYDMYDDSVSMEDKDFYVMTDNFNVYKCIYNTGIASTVKPTGYDAESQTYADGYIWKFIYNIPTALRNKFITADYIPVQNALTNQFYSNGEIDSVTIVSGGTGYTTASITITGDGTGASIAPVTSGGSITNYVINDAGSGYTYASLAVTGNGTGAELTANLSVGDINTLQANIELQAVDGSIESIIVENGGTGFTTATVSIDGDGTGATASATVVDGVVTKILMTDIGSGYTWANVSITGGTGATARAIISPKGGHGKNAINEFFDGKIMFSSTLSNEKNQGLVVANDYRQTGIIKNILEYDSESRYRLSNGSSCFRVNGVINASKFPIDSLVYLGANNRQFLVVASYTNSILLQSLDNAVPVVGSIFKNSALDSFTTVTVTDPSIDKFSGDLLYIDNVAGFQPTAAQAVNFRTIIGF